MTVDEIKSKNNISNWYSHRDYSRDIARGRQ